MKGSHHRSVISSAALGLGSKSSRISNFPFWSRFWVTGVYLVLALSGKEILHFVSTVQFLRADGQSSSRTPAYLKTSSCIFLRCWTKITHNNLKLFWFAWGSFEIPKLVYLHAQLGEKKTYRIRLAWEEYCNWYFEAPKWIDYCFLKETNLLLSQRISQLEKFCEVSENSLSGSLCSFLFL